MIGKKIEKNNRAIALNVLYAKKGKKFSVFVSKHNSNCKKQVFLLVIPSGEGWYNITLKTLPALLRGITSKHHGDFYCLNCLHSFTINQPESHKKVREEKDF